MNLIIRILYFIILLFDNLLKTANRKYLKQRIYQKLRDNYIQSVISNKKLILFTPSIHTRIRAENINEHEPETIEWIKKFKKKKLNEQIIFWDIGACVGQFSLISSLLHENILSYAFEPSTKNLNIISTNISINKFEKKIIMCPLPLSNTNFDINIMNEKINEEGKASNFFDNMNDIDLNFKYSTLGISIDYLVDNKIFKTPDYIKIDTDGQERFILDGAKQLLKSNDIQEIQIELTDNTEDMRYCLSTLKKNNFKIIKKFRERKYTNIKKHENLFNYRLKKIINE